MASILGEPFGEIVRDVAAVPGVSAAVLIAVGGKVLADGHTGATLGASRARFAASQFVDNKNQVSGPVPLIFGDDGALPADGCVDLRLLCADFILVVFYDVLGRAGLLGLAYRKAEARLAAIVGYVRLKSGI